VRKIEWLEGGSIPGNICVNISKVCPLCSRSALIALSISAFASRTATSSSPSLACSSCPACAGGSGCGLELVSPVPRSGVLSPPSPKTRLPRPFSGFFTAPTTFPLPLTRRSRVGPRSSGLSRSEGGSARREVRSRNAWGVDVRFGEEGGDSTWFWRARDSASRR